MVAVELLLNDSELELGGGSTTDTRGHCMNVEWERTEREKKESS